jgi:16S rRNA (guanine1207-N2)-methyltransferase
MNDHYYSENPKSKLIIERFTTSLRGNEITLFSGSSCFSIGSIDNGSKLLINNALIKSRQRILDLGCGYGAVGIAIGKAYPDCEIVMTDINKRAVMLSRKGVEKNELTNCTLVSGNLYSSITGEFDTILLNPPHNAGKKICFEMIEKAPVHLKKGGSLQLVARHKKGGKQLEAIMEETFGNVSIVKRGSGYRIYISYNEPKKLKSMRPFSE